MQKRSQRDQLMQELIHKLIGQIKRRRREVLLGSSIMQNFPQSFGKSLVFAPFFAKRLIFFPPIPALVAGLLKQRYNPKNVYCFQEDNNLMQERHHHHHLTRRVVVNHQEFQDQCHHPQVSRLLQELELIQGSLERFILRVQHHPPYQDRHQDQ